jgi:hypothetical protein
VIDRTLDPRNRYPVGVRGEQEEFTAADGSERTLAWAFTAERQLLVMVLNEAGEAQASFTLPSQFCGNFGGSEIVFSPRGGFAAIFMHSGQSEQGYELFAVAGEVRHLGGVPYAIGAGGPPVFAPDDSRVVLVNFRGGEGYSDEADGRARVHYSRVYVQTLGPSGPPRVCDLIVEVAASAANVLVDDLRGPYGLRFTGPDAVSIRVAGGGRAVGAVPDVGDIVVRPPGA